jgi:hypothetical protein
MRFKVLGFMRYRVGKVQGLGMQLTMSLPCILLIHVHAQAMELAHSRRLGSEHTTSPHPFAL